MACFQWGALGSWTSWTRSRLRSRTWSTSTTGSGERLWHAWFQESKDGDKDEARRLKALVDLVTKKVNFLRDDNGRNKCLEFAHTMREHPLHILGDELDADPWLLGCANGVLDLRTGLLRKGRAEDYIA